MDRRSTVGNKTRMKEMGLDQGEGFTDLDETMASPLAVWKRPWWVCEVDKPTMDIDWDATERFDADRKSVV